MPALPTRRPLRLLLAVLLVAAGFGAVASSAAVASSTASAARVAVARLSRAAHVQRVADHRLVKAAHQLKRCRRLHGACAAKRRAVQTAGHRLQRAQRRLNRLARHQAKGAQTRATAPAPTIAVNGQSLRWDAVSNVDRYVFVRKVPGQADQYSLLRGTSLTPPVVPGKTVRYSARADVKGSVWAPEVSISYPDASGSTSTSGSTGPSLRLLAAPQLTASGTALSWNQVGDVTTYVLVRRIAGQSDQYTSVSGMSVTPAAVPGSTASYSVRTAVDGSAWSTAVAVTYPAAPQQDPTPDPSQRSTPPTPVAGGFQMGLVSGSAPLYQLPWLQQLRTHTARLEFGIGSSAASMASTMDAYARAGIRPLLLASFYGRLPTSAEAQNLASWAAAYGPGGSFWQGKSYTTTPGVTAIEFGNETSYSYQFSDYSLPTYAARAQSYAQRAKEAATAIRAANANVGLVAIGDNAVNQDAWVVNMFRAVPDLGDYVVGWTIHPYGPNWAARIDSTINSTRAAGSRDLPIWVTEWGLATDNGRCLDDNYGFDKCMTYGAAGSTLHTVLSGMQSRYGSRLGAFYLFQANDQFATGISTSRERYFGALQNTGAAKGAYTAEVMGDLAAH
jgi:hypothetical protein